MIGAFIRRDVLPDGSTRFRISAEVAGEATMLLVNGSRAQRNVHIAVSR
jgi:hypothetical protein